MPPRVLILVAGNTVGVGRLAKGKEGTNDAGTLHCPATTEGGAHC